MILLGILLLIGVFLFFLFFHTKTAKNLKIGNNTSSQEIVNYILNISSYEAKIEVEVNSNKNKNRYILKQRYQKPDLLEQEILEPSNISGIKMIKNKDQLKLENSDLNLTTIFENYEYVSDNHLDLSSFIKDYKEDEKANWEEENDKIKMSTTKNQEEKNLIIERATKKPIKLEIKGKNQNTKIYILYNEININSLK